MLKKNEMVVDRVEGDTAVVEKTLNNFVDIPVSLIKGNVRDGAILRKVGPDQFEVDEASTKSRSEDIKEKARKLFK